MSTAPASRQLAVIGRAAAGQPRTVRLEPLTQPAASRAAAYRRLAVAILGLDVPTLALELRTARQQLARPAPRAA
jgi:hypothetical protein